MDSGTGAFWLAFGFLLLVLFVGFVLSAGSYDRA